MIRLKTAIMILICLAASLCWAQPKFQTTISFSMGFPQGEFSDNVGNTGYGLDTEFRYRLGHSPVSIGGTLGFLQYGSVSRVVPLSPTVPDVLVKVDTTNNILFTQFLVRYEFGDLGNRVKPYAEGLIGLNYLWTQTAVDNYDNDLTTTNFDDTTGTFGAGGGVLFGLYRGPAGMPQLFRIDLEMGARYVWGGNAQYLAEGYLVRPDGSITYHIRESHTNMLMVNIGMCFSF